MDIKKRRFRRVTLLIVILLVLVGGATGLVYFSRWQQQRKAAHEREVGVAAYKAGNYKKAIKNLKAYNDYSGTDAETFYDYARARLHVPLPNQRHVGLALHALNQAVKKDPDNLDAAGDLLDLRKMLGQNDDALDLANHILRKHPNNVHALASKAFVLQNAHQPKKALKAAMNALKLEPDSYAMHLLVLQLRHDAGVAPGKLVHHALELAEKHPDDPHFEMAVGYAYGLTNQTQRAKKWLSRAAKRPIKDAQFAKALVGVLDQLGMYDESLAVLVRVSQPDNKAGLFNEMLHRLFEAQHYGKVLNRLSEVKARRSSEPAKVSDAVLKAMTLFELKEHDKAAKVVQSLNQRKNAPIAHLWADVLKTVYRRDHTAAQVIDATKTALATVPSEAYLYAFLGNAYAASGDGQLAVSAWKKAAALRPSWANIRTRISRELLAQGQTKQAMGFALAAIRRQPSSVDAAMTIIRARIANLPDNPKDSPAKIMNLLNQVRKAAPHQPQVTLLRVKLLAAAGQKQQAVDAIQNWVKDTKKISQSVALQLAGLSKHYKLGLSDSLLDTLQKEQGLTSDLALARAGELAQQGKPQQGYELLQRGKKQAPAKQQEAWRLSIATYLARINDPRAAQAWIALADAHPKNVRLQQMALRVGAVRKNRAFTGRVINRLKHLMGKDSITWRLQRARWLLGSPKPQSDAPKAASLLREVIKDSPKQPQPRLLLARSLELLNKPQAAIRELRAAEQSIADSPGIALELARLYQRVRQYPNARDYLRQVTNNKDATVKQLRQAATLLAREGQDTAATRVFETLNQQGELNSTHDLLLLASLYNRTGRNDRADQLVQQVLKHPTPDAIGFALSFYGTQQQQDRVRQVMQLLAKSRMSGAAKAELRGNYQMQMGNLPKAEGAYKAAVQAAPKDPERWHQLVRFELTRGDGDAALNAAQRGLKQLPRDQALLAVRQQAGLIHELTGVGWVRPMLISLLNDPSNRETARKALETVARLKRDNKQAGAASAQLRKMADDHQDFLALQDMAAVVLMASNQPQAAADIAGRAARAFPTSAEPAALQAKALASYGQWGDALGAALAWRNRLSGSPLNADLLIAQTKLQLGDANGTLQALSPYIKRAEANPNAYPRITTRLTRAYLAQHRYQEAGKLMLPLVSKAAKWRYIAMQLASTSIDDKQAASHWLERIDRAMPADAANEKLSLGQSWWSLAQRLSVPAFEARARDLIDQVTAQPKAPAAAWYMRGLMDEKAQKPEAAIKDYRQALKKNPQLTQVQNNLAMLLSERGSASDEALQLAKAAVSTTPGNPNYLDTLAHVQADAHQCDAAVSTIKKAIALDPDNTQWKRSLADILKSCGKKDAARKVLDELGTGPVSMR